jgi:hypothetical protein
VARIFHMISNHFETILLIINTAILFCFFNCNEYIPAEKANSADSLLIKSQKRYLKGPRFFPKKMVYTKTESDVEKKINRLEAEYALSYSMKNNFIYVKYKFKKGSYNNQKISQNHPRLPSSFSRTTLPFVPHYFGIIKNLVLCKQKGSHPYNNHSAHIYELKGNEYQKKRIWGKLIIDSSNGRIYKYDLNSKFIGLFVVVNLYEGMSEIYTYSGNKPSSIKTRKRSHSKIRFANEMLSNTIIEKTFLNFERHPHLSGPIQQLHTSL